MRLSRKHAGERSLVLGNFDGGLNLSANPEAIANNELSMCQNWEYDFTSGTLKTRDGLELIKDTGYDIDTLYYADNGSYYLFSSGTSLYKMVGTTVSSVGTLTGANVPKFTQWDDKTLIASGGALQSYDGTTLASTGSSNADIVFTRAGRVAIARSGYDYLIYSGVGDETNWTAGTASDMQEIEIGYKDAGDIIAAVQLSTDVIVFKSSGSIFRIVNEFPDWIVYEVTKTSKCLNRFSALPISNDVFYLDYDGFKSLGTVQAYGDVKAVDAGYKINAVMSQNISTSAAIWHVRNKGQIWVKPQNDVYIWVYHIISGAWTKFSMTAEVKGHATNGTAEYIAIGQKIYSVTPNESTDDSVAIFATFKGKRFVSDYRFLVKAMRVNYTVMADATGSLNINTLSLPLTAAVFTDIAFLDTDIAYLDTDPLIGYSSNRATKRCVARMANIIPEVIIDSGAVAIREISLRVTEV